MNFVIRVLAVMGLTVAGLGHAAAAPITVTGSAVSLDKLGLATGYNSDYDKLDVHAFGPVTFNLQHDVPTTVTLSDFDFIVDLNAWVPQAGYRYTLNVPFTVNGVSGVLSQPFLLDISYSDTLTLQAGPTATFNLPGGGHVEVTLLAQPAVTVGPQTGVYHGHLSALVVEMPEPATLAVFGGVALAGVVGYRRRKSVA